VLLGELQGGHEEVPVARRPYGVAAASGRVPVQRG
jgi:hypothetical protein